ncbi:MAG: hypothetical protein OXG78_01880 [Chloroflexi bacterium]|nr:hypothetical protein [Chloroflexota bacterium]
MSRRRKSKGKSRKPFRYETRLAPDAALERLQDLEGYEQSDSEYVEKYRISSEKPDDIIFFEVEVLRGQRLLPLMVSRIVSGQINQIGPERTLIEGELHIPPLLQAIRVFFVVGGILLLGAVALLYLNGMMPESDFVIIAGVLVIGALLYFVFRGGKDARDRVVVLIGTLTQPGQGDQYPAAWRRNLRNPDAKPLTSSETMEQSDLGEPGHDSSDFSEGGA